MVRVLAFVLLVCCVLAGQPVSADTPTMISYQGYLSQDGSPVPDATYTVQFRIYDGLSAELWMEEHQVETDGGHFTVQLGSLPGTAITADLFNGDDRYLGITVESQSEMTPRIRLVSQPYSFRTSTIDGAAGGNIASENNWRWDVGDGWGDLSIGDGTYGLSIGVATAGGGAGSVRLWTAEGAGRIKFGNSLYGDRLTIEEEGIGVTSEGPVSITIEADTDNINEEDNPSLVFSQDNGGVTCSIGLNDKNCLEIMNGYSNIVDVNSLIRINHGHWPNHGEGLELKYDSVGDKGYIQVYDRESSSWGNLQIGGDGQNVSVGSSSFVGRLHVRSSHADAGFAGIGIYSSGGSADIAWPDGEYLQFGTWDGAEFSEKMVIKNDGVTQVCILDIIGGCDLAEPFPMTNEYLIEEGCVVVIDEDNPGQLKLSQTAYDSRVAGIVSGAGGVNPGITLSMEEKLGEGHQVSLTGRVYCKADATYGSIRPGDMLTTSNTPGHAMVATDRNRSYGAVIGKAMTSLDDGRGLVLVLVNLQ